MWHLLTVTYLDIRHSALIQSKVNLIVSFQPTGVFPEVINESSQSACVSVTVPYTVNGMN